VLLEDVSPNTGFEEFLLVLTRFREKNSRVRLEKFCQVSSNGKY